MHLKRWLTSIVAIPILVALIWKGSLFLFASFIALLSMVALWEYYRIVLAGDLRFVLSRISTWGGLISVLLIYAADAANFRLMTGLLMINLIGAAVLSMPRYKHEAGILDLVAREIQGIIYIPLTLSTLVLLRGGLHGAAWIFFVLFVVFSGDAAAFYCGRYYGKHKLSPFISPGKTVEGAAGSLVISVAVGCVFMLLFLPHLPAVKALLALVLINISAQAGDLFESVLKRAVNIKDSGSILPGHGGLLDRIDALLFAAPVTYLLKIYLLAV